MMYRTHLMFALVLALAFFPFVHEKIFFIPLVLACSLLPDIDCMHSKLGRHWFFRPLQWFIKHRGLLHSLTLALCVAVLLSFVLPVVAFPFFLGYTSHLLGDALTEEGIRPWWPFRREIEGFLRTGGRIEQWIFWGFVVLCLILMLRLLLG